MMAESTLHDYEYVVIHGVSPTAYERVLEAVGHCHLRHTYDRGDLEILRVLHAVDARAYRKLIEAIPESYLRHTYDGWTLEMMTPGRNHEWVTGLLRRMVETMAFTLGIPIQTTGSMTLACAAHESGLQPDGSYYVQHEPEVRGRDEYRPGVDPSPDLVIEVDVTSSCLPRLPVFAKLGVPEIWRYGEDGIQIYCLTEGGEYRVADRSAAFPFVTAAALARFLEQRRETEENSVIRAFVEWARTAYSP